MTAEADHLFPDRHADFAVDMLRAVRDSLGDEALDAVLESRTERQAESYRERIGTAVNLRTRVDRLAAQRTREGYLAEVVRSGRDLLLIEHHCPICDAAKECAQLCRYEKELFTSVLGDVHVERTSHLLAGDARCVYRISPNRSSNDGR
ncbi:MAG: hypothetical protein R2705_08735 [Ilumatobacteraceae bacterium]